MKTIAIVGASNDRKKFGNKAVRAYALKGFQVFPIHPSASEIEGLPVYHSVLQVPVNHIDRASMYLPAAAAMGVLEELRQKAIDEVWFNPGADHPDVVARAHQMGLNVVLGCSILDIGISPAEFSDQ